MDFQLTSLQEDLRDTTRKLCTGRFPVDGLRAASGHLDSAAWSELAGAGVFSLRQPEKAGGLGLGATDAAVVFEELGKGLVPGPIVWSHLAAGLPAGGIVGGVERPAAGQPIMIEHLADLDVLVVLDGDGIWSLDPGALKGSSRRPFDPLTPVWEVDALPRGEQVGDPVDAARWRTEGAALVAAQLVGLAVGVCDLTVGYARQRRQFGRPIGSFQAVKHALADMLVRAELARVQAYAAAAHIDEPELGGTERAVSAAKVVAGQAAYDNGKAAIQLHGGMGMTWEVDAHLYLKRAWVLNAAFGTADQHAEAVAAGLGDVTS